MRFALSLSERCYEELAGWKCQAAGGPNSKSLTPEQRKLDREVCLLISGELGHGQEAVTVTYLGH